MSDFRPSLGTLARNIRVLRAARQLSQGQLADLCPTITQWRVSTYERGIVPTRLHLREIAAALGVAPSVLSTEPLVADVDGAEVER